MFDRRLLQHFDWGLLFLTGLLGAIGVLNIYSAVTAGEGTYLGNLYIKQMIWYGGAFGGMLAIISISYKQLERWAMLIYIVCLLMLVAVLVFGKYVGGSQRWLALGPVSIQPSEMVKIAVIIMLARYYAKLATARGFTLKELGRPLLITTLPFALIVRQPDLGTAMMVALIAASITFFMKIERRSLVTMIMIGLLGVPPIWSFFLKDYQKQRILTFLSPERDPLGSGYHIIQSKIAIGSGQLTGKGFLHGTQNSLSFLPEQHTDFIFSVIAEEWGFAGGAALLVILMLLIVKGLNIAHRCRDPFGTVLCLGITAMLFWQIFINVGMVMGLMPVVGVPLPLVSYGGSSTLTVMVSISLLMNVSMRRFMRD